jgi:hypothetical protein
MMIWADNKHQYAYYGSYSSHKQCDEMALRINSVTRPGAFLPPWICVETPQASSK